MDLRGLTLHLSLIKGVGVSTCRKLYQALHGDIEHLYAMDAAQIMQRAHIPQALAQGIVSGLKDRSLLDRELLLIEKYSISWYTLFDDQYPALLKEIHSPPLILYCKGTLPTMPMLAVVGSRAANQYARNVIESFVPSLVAQGFAIVSGGALGADAMAHQATINAQGKTIVVLGSGLLKPYPAAHKKLFENVLAHDGALISSFSLETTPLPGNFPARNRIIAGLSKGCIVVQAAKESGAKITALFALEQGRDVFAIPGSIFDPLSAGCHELIGQGATLVHQVDDILNAYSLSTTPAIIPAFHIQSEVLKTSAQIAEVKKDEPLAHQIIKLCAQPQSLDYLVESLNLDLLTAQTMLFDLQMCGLLEQNVAGLWKQIR